MVLPVDDQRLPLPWRACVAKKEGREWGGESIEALSVSRGAEELGSPKQLYLD